MWPSQKRQSHRVNINKRSINQKKNNIKNMYWYITQFVQICQSLSLWFLQQYISLVMFDCTLQVWCISWYKSLSLAVADLCNIEIAYPLQCLTGHKNAAWLYPNLQSLWRSILQSETVYISLPSHLPPNLETFAWHDLHTALKSQRHSSPMCQ